MDVDTNEWPEQTCDSESESEMFCNNGFDSAGKILEHLLTNIPESGIDTLQPKDSEWASKGYYKKFNQKEFLDTGLFEVTGLQRFGYIFYPEQCIEKSCHIHFHLHGCGGMDEYLGIYSGFGDYAVSNDIIMVYP